MRGIMGGKSFDISVPHQDDKLGKSGSKWSLKNRKKRWLPIVFCSVCFSLLIGWVIRDIFYNHPDAFTDTGVNDTASEAVEFENVQEISGRNGVLPISVHHCLMESDCTILCEGMNVTDLSAAITKVLEVSKIF
nr:uncharacterized protein LOC115269489 [Aedes albopictus]